MADNQDQESFDLNAYFDRKLGPVGTDKIMAVRQASAEKYAQLEAFRQNLAAADPVPGAVPGSTVTPNEKSWVNRLGLDPNGIPGEAVNLAANVYSGLSSNVIGKLAALPFTQRTTAAELQMQQADIEAYNRYVSDEATPEDMARLNRQVAQPSFADAKGGMSAAPKPQGEFLGMRTGDPTMLDLIKQAQSDRQTSRSINNFFDVSSVEHSGKKTQFDKDLAVGFQDNWNKIKEGAGYSDKGLLSNNTPGLDQMGNASMAGKQFQPGDLNTVQTKDGVYVVPTQSGKKPEESFAEDQQFYGRFKSQDEATAFIQKVNKLAIDTPGGKYTAPADVPEATKMERISMVTKGIANILLNTGTTALKNPTATLEYAAENAPQLLVGAIPGVGGTVMTASNVGYAADFYQQGMENYQKAHGGQLPSKDQQASIAAWAASLAISEELGDRVGLAAGKLNGGMKAITGVGEGASKMATEGAVDTATKSFKDSILGTLKAAGEAGVTEAATEGYQGFAENKTAGKPDASAWEIYQQAVVGGLSGAHLSGTAHGVQEIRLPTSEKAQATVQEKADFKAAVEKNDPSVYMDESNRNYNPSKAVGVLFTHNQLQDTTPEVRQENVTKAAEINSTLQDKYDALEQSRKDAAPAEAKQITAQMSALRRHINDTENLIDSMVSQNSAIKTPEQVTTAVNEVASNDSEVATNAADKVLNLAMTNTSALSHEQINTLVNDSSNALTDDQRNFLRTFSEARQQANALSTMGKVSQEVLAGSPDNIGINQFHQRIGNAIATGRQDVASRQLGLLTAFATDHADKATVAAQAVKQALESGQTTQILKKQDGSWFIPETNVSEKERKANAGLDFKVSTPKEINGSKKIAREIGIESQALNAAKDALTNAVALKFPDAGVQSVPSTATVPAKVTTAVDPSATTQPAPAPENKQGVSPNNSSPEAKKPSPRPEVNSEQTGKDTPPVKNKATLTSATEQEAKLNAQLAAINEKNAAKKAEQQQQQSTPATETVQPEAAAQPAVASEAKQAPAVQVATAEEQKPATVSPAEEAKKPFQERNLVQAHMTEKAGKDTGSVRPLVAEPTGFLASLKADASHAMTYLKDKAMTEQQMTAVKDFANTATDWVGKIQAFFKPKNPKFRYEDMVQFLVDEHGQLKENVKTAIAYGTYSWIAENIANILLNTPEQINAILQQDKDAFINDTARYLLTEAGTRENVILNSMGQSIYQALGLTSLVSASQDLQPKMISHLGAYALKLALDEGLIERHTISGEDFARMMNSEQTTRSTQQYATQKFIRPGPNTTKVEDIRTAMKGSQGILNKLFGAESSLKQPALTKIPFQQKFAGDSQQTIAPMLAKVMAYENAQPHYVREDMFQLFTQLHPDVALAIAGFQSINKDTTHVVNRKSIEAKNEGLQREYDRGMEFFGELNAQGKLTDPLFFSHNVWVQNRVGIDTNMVNPQTSKLHRRMLARPSWTVTIPFSDTAAMKNFKLRVAEGLGIKTDKQSNEVSLEQLSQQINQPEIKQAVKVLRKLVTGETMTSAEQQDLLAGVQATGQNMHGLDALMAMAHFTEAMKQGKTEFTTQLMSEVDGVTNGPMLSHFLLGAGENVDQMFQLLNRGGFYAADSGDTNYNLWRGTQGNRDLYENTAAHMAEAILNQQVDQKTMQAIYTFTGKLVKEDGVTPTKDGRNIVKTPLTAMVFGSAISNSVASMADEFVKSVYAKIEDAAKTGEEADRQAIITGLQTLGINIDPKTTIKDMMEMELSEGERQVLIKQFTNTVGKAVATTMKQDFKAYLDKRRIFNTTASLAFDLYNAVYSGLREQKIADLIKSGDIAVNPNAKEQVGLHDLTKAQEEALRKEVMDILPLVHTAFSQESGQLNAGLMASKIERELSQDKAYGGEIAFATKFPDGPSSIRTHAMQVTEKEPGAGTLVKLVHSFDSFISHTAVMKSEVLNIHDAHGAGVANVYQAARNLNQSTWNGLLAYSPTTQLADTLSRVIQGVASMQEAGKLPAASQERLQAVLAKYATDLKTQPGAVLDTMLNTIREQARQSDDLKLQVLEKLGHVDQYALQGGQYDVTAEDRAQAKKARMALQFEENLSKEDNTALATLSALASNQVQTKEQVSSEIDTQQDTVPDVPSMPSAVALQILEKMGEDVAPAREALIAGESLANAMAKIDGKTQAGRIQQLGERYKALQVAQNSPWGELGAPSIESHQGLVDAFNHDPIMPAKQAIGVLRTALKGNPESRTNNFNLQLLNLLEKTVPKDMTVQMVTPATPASAVLEKGADKSRGWFVAKGDKQAVYLLSPDFKYSGLTSEVMLHEMVHSALATTVEAALAEGKGPAHDLVQELESLRSLASQYVQDNKLTQFGPALSNVHEFLAWGMSNLDFQRTVLNKIQMASKAGDNKLVTAMKRFIETLTGLLFKGTNKSVQEQMENGMAVLIANASGLFHASAQTKSKTDLILAQTHTMGPNINSFTTQEIFDALPGGSSQVFTGQLKGLLSSIIDTLHGPFASKYAAWVQQQATTPAEVFANALQSGEAPFASKSLAAGFHINEQEAFVLEQVEATMRVALENNEGHTTMAYQELAKLYQEAAQKLQGKMPQALYDFVFKIEAGKDGKSDYLARFAALGLAHEDTAKLLQFATDVRTERDLKGLSFYEKLHEVYDALLSWLSRTFTHTFEGQQADEKLDALVRQLVGIEAKKRMKLGQMQNRTVEYLENTVKDLAEGAKSQVEKFGRSAFFKQNSNAFIKATGSLASAVAGGRVLLIMEGIAKLRDEQFRQRHGVLAGILDEIRGSRPDNVVFHELLRVAKHIEGERKDIKTNVAKFVMESFANGGADLTKEHKAAITAVFLRTDLAALLNKQGDNLEEISRFVQDPVQLKKEISRLEKQLGTFANFGDYFIKAAHGLGYYKATGRAVNANLMLSAHNIAMLYGTPYANRINYAQAQKAMPVIDRLTTLYALSHVDEGHLALAQEVLAKENARGAESGIEMILKLHQSLQQESKDRLFQSGEALHMKGYVPELFNPYIDLRVATEDQGQSLVDQGYSKGADVHQDFNDPNQDKKTLYVLRDGGLQSYLTGTLSMTGQRSKGTRVITGGTSLLSVQGLTNLNTMSQIAQNKAGAIRQMFNPEPGFNPAKVGDNHMVPVLNAQGDIVNYRYMMAESTKDNLLERNNAFEQLLGTMASSIYDKEMTKTQNETVIKALKAQHDAEIGERAHSYLVVGENSTNPELREIWRLLPEVTKQSVREIWGSNNMKVRTDLLDINFGYRKLSLRDTMDEEVQQDHAVARVIAEMATFMFGEKARLRLGQFEDIWQAFVREAKDTMVVKSGVTLMGNISSNLTELFWFGVPLPDILRHHRVAMKGALAYRKDSEALERIKLQLSTGYLPLANQKDLERQKLILEDSLARNPVKELIDAGMMPTIVEDVAGDDDQYSFKGRFTRKVDEFVDKLNPHVVNTAKTLMLAHDTPLYKALSYGTQLSDFVARYTLYQHLTQREKNPMAKREALQLVSDAFINYDVPSHRMLQYANDMGLVYFSKYYLRIQKTIMHLYKENPGRALMLLTASHFFDHVPTLMDSAAVHRFGNPFSTGALKYVTTLDETATINALMTPFK